MSARGTILTRDKRNQTGVVGISVVRTNLPSGRICRFFSVHLGGTNRKFNVDTLGKEEAWRRALQLRAQHEVRTLSAAVAHAGGLE